jgi:hypothetical protein
MLYIRPVWPPNFCKTATTHSFLAQFMVRFESIALMARWFENSNQYFLPIKTPHYNFLCTRLPFFRIFCHSRFCYSGTYSSYKHVCNDGLSAKTSHHIGIILQFRSKYPSRGDPPIGRVSEGRINNICHMLRFGPEYPSRGDPPIGR